MSDPTSTVFLVDDDDSVRRALARLLRASGHQVTAFKTAQEFRDANVEGAGPACIVLDLQMPGLSGLDLQRELHLRRINLPIVFITGHGDVPSSVRAMKDGAVDFLSKPVAEVDLLAAVEQALARDSQQRGHQAEFDAIRARAAKLTPREREVMELVVQGLLNKQIAARLGTVEKTVKVHRGRIMEKMEVKSLADLVRRAERLGSTLAQT